MKEKKFALKDYALMAEIERLDDVATGRLRATVQSAHRLDDDVIEKLEKVLQHRTGAKEIMWKNMLIRHCSAA
jgi:F0F1-type ATP synthase delta subunit